MCRTEKYSISLPGSPFVLRTSAGRSAQSSGHGRSRLINKKTQEASEIRFQYSTTGVGIDFQCLSHECILEERATEPTGERDAIQKTYHVVVAVEDLPVREVASVLIEATYWNAFQDVGEAHGSFVVMRVHAPVETLSLTLLLPETDGSYAFNKQSLRYKPFGGSGQPWDDPKSGTFLEDRANRRIYWELREPAVGNAYQIDWEWNLRGQTEG